VPPDSASVLSGGTAHAPAPANPDEIQLDDLDEEPSEGESAPAVAAVPTAASAFNPEEISIEDDIDDSTGAAPTESVPTSAPQQSDVAGGAGAGTAPGSEQSPPRHTTRFLALDKCLPRRQYMHVCCPLHYFHLFGAPAY
jgi:hypothetical protein